MANIQNLRPCEYKFTQEDHKKANEARKAKNKRRKTMQEIAQLILKMSVDTGKVVDINKIKSIADIAGKNISVDEAIVIKQMEKALKGDLKSAEFLRDTSGQTIVQKVQQVEPPQIVDDI